MPGNYLKALTRLAEAAFVQSLFDGGILPPVGVLQAAATAGAYRLAEFRSDSPQFLAAKSALIESHATTQTVSLTRRIAQQVTTIDQADGEDREFIWITEADESTCDACLANAAVVKKLSEWQRDGLPGASTCLGGDKCRCDLYPAD